MPLPFRLVTGLFWPSYDFVKWVLNSAVVSLVVVVVVDDDDDDVETMGSG